MTPERWALVKDIFAEAAAARHTLRHEILQSRCGDDPDLRAEVVRLLQHHETPTDGTLDVSPGSSHAPRHFLHATDRIGSYQIISVLGEGGMGVVYLAEQDNPKRTVALKLIRPGYASGAILRRFAHEAQVLGRLQHPGIAQIYEAGTANTGRGPQPFFAMELVRGRPLTDYASATGLDLRQRLGLFAQVCDTVQHAHLRGVVHRDLKPGNILVDETGQPKILDFGVARAIDSDVQMTTIQTDAGQILGTIPYMSPEQAAGEVGDVDTRSDVYALGVVLYELLTGRLPYDLACKPAHEAVRVIREAEPDRMSSIDRVFRGDVETIVGKALEKERARRYQSADEFADDVRRHLRNEPIRARPPTTRYQIAKFAKLHRAHETAEAMAVNRFLQDLLASGEPLASSGKESTVRQILDQAAGRLEGSTLRDQPQLESEVRTSIALTYQALGLFARAEHHARAALATRRRSCGEEHPATAQSLSVLGQVLAQTGQGAEAGELLERAVEARRRLLGEESTEVAESLFLLGVVRLDAGSPALAERLFEEALRLYQRSLPAGHIGPAYALGGVSAALLARGCAAEAEPPARRALEQLSGALPQGHWHVVLTRALVGNCVGALGRSDEAEALLVSAWADLKDNPAVPPPRRRQVLSWIVALYDRMHDAEQAAAWGERLGAEAPPPGSDPTGSGAP